MAGTRQIITDVHVGGCVISGSYSFEWTDTSFDGYDWTLKPEDPGFQSWDDLDLISDILLDLTGLGTVQLRYFRMQGGSPRAWRTLDLTEANTPVSFPTGSGPNPKVVGDLAGAAFIKAVL